MRDDATCPFEGVGASLPAMYPAVIYISAIRVDNKSSVMHRRGLNDAALFRPPVELSKGSALTKRKTRHMAGATARILPLT